jgi:NADPH:quinone reductase-like Zn-dependent oxidoreductase
MKAVVCTRYGPPDVLKVEELATPVPRKNSRLGTTSQPAARPA